MGKLLYHLWSLACYLLHGVSIKHEAAADHTQGLRLSLMLSGAGVAPSYPPASTTNAPDCISRPAPVNSDC